MKKKNVVADQVNIELGWKIRKRRLSRKMTQQQLADLLGMSRASVVNIEHGRHELSVSRLYDISDKLSTTPARLLP